MTEGEKDRVALSYKFAYSPFWRRSAKNPFLRVNLDRKSGKMKGLKVESDKADFRTQNCQGKLL
jgi:hypothetical protein